ncbi:hypothetical protein GHYDROH2_16060 [Geobacter hydrogenophilus]|uniref:Uncharacterized protein n=1 Tax=Geobacter hydrogenophilus TaxID=40983 RepID=A0A9W6FZQ7_9BACT|nr:hypothetical protein GHYDROH2_16060 [Geobacter hydrogenophilus]
MRKGVDSSPGIRGTRGSPPHGHEEPCAPDLPSPHLNPAGTQEAAGPLHQLQPRHILEDIEVFGPAEIPHHLVFSGHESLRGNGSAALSKAEPCPQPPLLIE